MLDIQHASIPDIYLHYPKGAANALAGTVNTANGDGTTSYTALPTHTLNIVDSITLEYFSNQELTAPETELRVLSTNVDKISENNSVTVQSTGEIIFNTDGVYEIQVIGQFGCSEEGETGSIAFANRMNGQQIGKTVKVGITNSGLNDSMPLSNSILINAFSGDVLTMAMLCLSLDKGAVGLYTSTVGVEGWKDVASVKLQINKLGIMQ